VVWANFGEAFALLLESCGERGLWGFDFDDGYMGPDILGHVYMVYANSDPSWQAQYFTPWNVALMMARMIIGDNSERQVHDRIKAALLHPENIRGQSILLANLVVPETEAGETGCY
jgi:hypothetical protein